MINDYDKFAKMRQEQILKGEKKPHRFIEKPMMRSMLPDLTGKKVLMLGCGTGDESRILKEYGELLFSIGHPLRWAGEEITVNDEKIRVIGYVNSADEHRVFGKYNTFEKHEHHFANDEVLCGFTFTTFPIIKV